VCLFRRHRYDKHYIISYYIILYSIYYIYILYLIYIQSTSKAPWPASGWPGAAQADEAHAWDVSKVHNLFVIAEGRQGMRRKPTILWSSNLPRLCLVAGALACQPLAGHHRALAVGTDVEPPSDGPRVTKSVTLGPSRKVPDRRTALQTHHGIPWLGVDVLGNFQTTGART
jgi:hypothetical protein